MRPAARFQATSALVIGSMIPDLAYFIRWPHAPYGSHSLLGLATFCLPVGLVAVIAFERAFRRPLEFLLPESVRRALPPAPPITVLHLAVTSVPALVVGALTHILWDSLTDPNGLGPRLMPWVDRNLITIGGYRLFGHRLIKHCGTVLGGLAIVWALRRWYVNRPDGIPPASSEGDDRFRHAALVALLVLPGAAGVYAGMQTDVPWEWLQAIRYFLHRSVLWIVRTGGVLICLYSVIWWARQRSLFDGGAGSIPFMSEHRGSSSSG